MFFSSLLEELKIKKLLHFSCDISVFYMLRDDIYLLSLLGIVTAWCRFQRSPLGNLRDTCLHPCLLLKNPRLSLLSGWPSHLSLWRGTANMICYLLASSLPPHPNQSRVPSPTQSRVPGPQSHCMLAFLPDLLNCFDCCGKWIILKWEPGQIWFGLETTQGFKRSQQEWLGLVWFLCFHGVLTSPKRKQHSYPESKHLCF